MYGDFPFVNWGAIKTALVFGSCLNNTITIYYYNDGLVKLTKGSLFKLSDMDEEIIIKNENNLHTFKYEEIRFAALNVS
ncbi:hypothetical protein EPH95_02610 [Salicibibacter halophilus]|uniref:YolD-like family protein n=1 Tax=Salicibibacter halophilus TaxID=2502791 RepID=A0A514LEB2_9BACI|nr:hypothetical protein [Salicibibacter halophilus]QDI90198.1 hypothetical protein EPH95_02610 [Salicibibacter halophilus]